MISQTKVPQLVSFSAVVRNANNTPLANTSVSLRLTFRKLGQTGPIVYCALHQQTTNANGYITLQLNRQVLGIACNGAPSTAFENIPWEEGGFWMDVEYQTTPTSPFVNLGQLELASTFYSFVSKYAENVKGLSLGTANNDDVLSYESATNTWKAKPVSNTVGPQGPQGIAGPAGNNGVSITNTQIQNDSLKITLSNNITINAGYVKGAKGDTGVQGPAGNNGVSITNTQIQNDSLKITLSNNTTINAGYVKGPQGVQGPAGTNGISITNTQVINDSLKVTLSDGTTITAGYVKGAKGDTGVQGPAGILPNGTTAGNTAYWNGTQWVVNNSNIHNNGSSIGIGTTTPNASAKLEIASTTQGFLPPRMTTAQRNAISSPSAGLTIYNTTVNCLQWWNGTHWYDGCGNNTQPQYPAGSVFCASGPTAIVDVTNPATGKTWMNRNLGASRAATSSTDSLAYGDLYQWGRRSDGHQCRNSPTTSTLSSVDQPGNGSFILAPNVPWDWRSPQNTNLWQGINGINNPCPTGYRVPTKIEWQDEINTWVNGSNSSISAFNSVLKLPLSGVRRLDNGLIENTNYSGSYWSSNVDGGSGSYYLEFDSYSLFPGANYSYPRSYGRSVRCIKN
jgi:uncharacterized protein (TIGR02145 family)